jgi:pimeloyl-ACP methyl ester carboxylesterase
MSGESLPLVLLPGLLDDRHMWRHQIDRLGDVAAPMAVDLLDQVTIGEAADIVLDAVEGPFALAGFSMGGYVAFEIMRRAPERVARLALIDTSARADTPERRAERGRQITLAESGRFQDLVELVLPAVVHPDRVEDPVFMASLRDMAERVGADAFVRQQRTIMSRPDSRDDLKAIRCPTLVMCGRQDAVTPPALSQEMAKSIAGARLALIDDCGHYATMERPYAATVLLQQWLRYP